MRPKVIFSSTCEHPVFPAENGTAGMGRENCYEKLFDLGSRQSV